MRDQFINLQNIKLLFSKISTPPLKGRLGEVRIKSMPIKNIVRGQSVTKGKLERAKELRREMTPTKKIFWQELRANKLGVHFRRQQIIAGFIVDFYCHQADLVIEVDGNVHDGQEQKENDVEREKILKEMGLRVARFKNYEIQKNLTGMIDKIKLLVSK